jgi:hypothetical protein
MKKNNAKNTNKKNDIAAVAEVAAEETTNPIETMDTEASVESVDEDAPTVVTAEESASEPDASAEVEIHADATDPTEHHIRVKSDNGVYDVTVHAESRQDAKYRVYLNLEQFGPNAVLPKFDVDKYLARKNATTGKKAGKWKKGEGKKARNLIVVDLDAPVPETADAVAGDAAEAEA